MNSDAPPLAEVERNISRLERRLDNLGGVNMLAIEQYDETAKRIDQLIEDGSTLRKRKNMLVEIVERLESERKRRLLTVFEHINRNFSRVYAILQPGGNGRLRLENPESPFDGGLEMDCVPPGKSQKTRRSQLSGGEKSMAALALVSRYRTLNQAHSTISTRLIRISTHSIARESPCSVVGGAKLPSSSW